MIIHANHSASIAKQVRWLVVSTPCESTLVTSGTLEVMWYCRMKYHPKGSFGARIINQKVITSWWLNQPIWKYYMVKLDHETPRIRVKMENLWVATTQIKMVSPTSCPRYWWKTPSWCEVRPQTWGLCEGCVRRSVASGIEIIGSSSACFWEMVPKNMP